MYWTGGGRKRIKEMLKGDLFKANEKEKQKNVEEEINLTKNSDEVLMKMYHDKQKD